ncbi:MAG: GUN4 domain-containing protein [Fischerella thermalis M48_A2018_028]|nr:GUN4 domain-containing protein [Fischerella thermalis]MBF1988493.1 GUN4 domain-containing protein [Fischerella thermalis M58_A2018_009]MBF2058793.1 GUN4 domain-containing protein [Fischerella thermalis M66_A2018_004]MBF2070183.1 GUN4 domain-containing protein [Fischerella thermalis M48_A2018_028]
MKSISIQSVYVSDRYAWRIKQEWLKYSDLNFSLNAPQGHLPSRLVGVSPYAWGWKR